MTERVEHLQETHAHNGLRVRALKHEVVLVSAEVQRLAEAGLVSAVQALRAELDLLREELAVALTPLATVRAPGRKPAGEVEGG